MSQALPDPRPLLPGEVRVAVLGRNLRLTSEADAGGLERAVVLLERTFQDMEEAYRLRWGNPPAAVDTPTWLLLGALNLAHRVVSLEHQASTHTLELEQTLSKLLDDVPDDASAAGPSGPGI